MNCCVARAVGTKVSVLTSARGTPSSGPWWVTASPDAVRVFATARQAEAWIEEASSGENGVVGAYVIPTSAAKVVLASQRDAFVVHHPPKDVPPPSTPEYTPLAYHQEVPL